MRYIHYVLLFNLLFFTSFSQEKNSGHYVFPEFVKGKVLMKDGASYERLLNYNVLTEEMIFEYNMEKLAISSEDMVDTVFIKNRKFFRSNNKFLELIHTSSVDLYAEQKCSVSQPGTEVGYGQKSNNTAVNSVSFFKGNGLYRKLELPNDIRVKRNIHYWLKKDGSISRFIKLRQLLKLYPNKKAIFKSFVKEHNVQYKDEDSLVKLIMYLENND